MAQAAHEPTGAPLQHRSISTFIKLTGYTSIGYPTVKKLEFWLSYDYLLDMLDYFGRVLLPRVQIRVPKKLNFLKISLGQISIILCRNF